MLPSPLILSLTHLRLFSAIMCLFNVCLSHQTISSRKQENCSVHSYTQYFSTDAWQKTANY